MRQFEKYFFDRVFRSLLFYAHIRSIVYVDICCNDVGEEKISRHKTHRELYVHAAAANVSSLLKFIPSLYAQEVK